jgi:hypothetical protein
MEQNKGSCYITIKDITNDQRRENIQSQIQSRLNDSYQIVVNRTETVTQQSPQAYAPVQGQAKNFGSGSASPNP